MLMKRILMGAIGLLAACCLSISTLAATAYAPVPDKAMFNVKDGDTYIGVLKVSSLTAAQKNFLEEWHSSSRNLLVYSSGGKQITFMIMGKTYQSAYLKDNNLSEYGPCYFADSTGSLTHRTISFDADTGEVVSSKLSTVTSNLCVIGYLVSGTWFGGGQLAIQNSSIIGFEGDLIIMDDENMPEPTPTPPAPTPTPAPPTPSSEPVPPYIPSDKPDYPAPPDSSYILLDPSLLDDLVMYLRDTIGSVGKVLQYIVMLFIGLSILFAAVRHYLTQGKGNDGGGGLL